jgi:HlyD family secretion protein
MRIEPWRALFAGCVLFFGCEAKIAGRPAIAGPVTIKDGVRLSGTAEPVDSVDIKPEVSGRIVKVLIHEGDTVKTGQLLLQIDTVPFILARNVSALQVGRSVLALATAKRDLQRAQALDSTGSVSKDQLQDLKVAMNNAELNLRGANLALTSSSLDLLHTHIVAPMKGVLITFSVAVGTVASSAEGINGGTNLGTIADPSNLKVVVEVGELDYPRLQMGMPVQISTEGGAPRPGHVSFIPSSARASTDTKTIMVFPLEAVLDSASTGLMPGMTVGVDFVFLKRDVPVAVPYEAIRSGSSAAAGSGAPAKAGAASPSTSRPATVLVRSAKGVLESKPVRIGATDYRNTEILEGVAAGDTVWISDSTQSGQDKPATAAAKPGAPKGGAI